MAAQAVLFLVLPRCGPQTWQSDLQGYTAPDATIVIHDRATASHAIEALSDYSDLSAIGTPKAQ